MRLAVVSGKVMLVVHYRNSANALRYSFFVTCFQVMHAFKIGSAAVSQFR